MSVHSWQICVKNMCISEGISYMRQMQRTYTKVLHEIYPNVTKGSPCFFFCFFSNYFRFASYKYVKDTDQPIWMWFLLMISRQTDHKFEYGMVP